MSDTHSLCFSLTDGVGPKTFLKLLEYFGSTTDAWENLNTKNFKDAGMGVAAFGKFEVSRKNLNIDSYLEKLKKAKVKVISYSDEIYPENLKKLEAPPIVLYCKGNLDLLSHKRTVGIVGARKITSYGTDVTEKIVSELMSQGICIISGLAFGVDAAAHSTAIKNQGSTAAVLGCGVDCCTPAENQDLYEKILDNGGLIISEYPLGMPPSAGTFPARNRIIAGLSLGVLVTEAAEDSGSLITAAESLKLGRPVFAVPGSINSQMSRGALQLLKQGAILAQSGNDILEGLQLKIKNSKLKISSQNLKLSAEEKIICESLENESLPLDLLSKQAKIPIIKLMALTSGLEMKGIVKNKNGELTLK